jgi:carbonic anhydrase
MSNVTELLDRNRSFAEQFDGGDLAVRPRISMIIVTCLDARVDPAHFLGLELGDSLVVRNAGGRITPAVLQDLVILGVLAATVPGPSGMQLELAVIQHTDCGMARLADPATRQMAATRLSLTEEEVAAMAIPDPAASVRGEIERLRTTAGTPDQMVASGYVYDVADGSVEEIVAPAPLRAPS